jgi:uncharacterized protein YjeT (DUF2065 family)
MIWSDLAAAFALLLVFEGLLPFLVPRRYRVYLMEVARLPESTLRIFGLVSVLLGLALLTWVRG